jgi:hypothetical protein
MLSGAVEPNRSPEFLGALMFRIADLLPRRKVINQLRQVFVGL